jgi:5-(carboxyamino)imidazole ribonucleotide mutase
MGGFRQFLKQVFLSVRSNINEAQASDALQKCANPPDCEQWGRHIIGPALKAGNDPGSLFFVIRKNRYSVAMNQNVSPLVGVIMGSTSDWETMSHAHRILTDFGVVHECRVVSAHRTPVLMAEYAQQAESRGLEVIIAGAGGAAHLPGMVAAHTLLPVLGVPVQSKALSGQDSLLSIVQMPGGIPVGTLAIGQAGAINAALLAVAILSNSRPDLREKLRAFRQQQTDKVLKDTLP